MFPTLDDIRERLPDTRDSQRFLAQVKVGDIPTHRPELGPCILWDRACDSRGYGIFRAGGKLHRAHTWVFTAMGGIVPAGMELDHICHEPKVCTVPVKECPHRPCVVHVVTATHWENSVLRGNSPPAINYAKTHCAGKYSPRAADGTIIGHPWYNDDGTLNDNVYIAPDGTRKCKPCQRAREHAWHERAARLKHQARQRELPEAGQLLLLEV